tara:strand:- start:190 stop:642 length:453 start_codon:yes stop_codon:yes gene_type:complete
MRHFESPAELAQTKGEAIGPSDPITIDQAMIDGFADVTGDRQWIHIDTERAAREAPGGTTIAHGYLLLSLLGTLQPKLYTVKAERVLNVGLNKLRFLAPVPAGSRVSLSEKVVGVEEQAGGLRISNEITLHLAGADKPAMVAEIVFLYFG